MQYQNQQQFQQKQLVPKKEDWEIALENIASPNSQIQEKIRNNIKNTITYIKNLEVQLVEIAQ